MEHVLQVDAHRAVVRIGLHDVSHIIPPFPVDGSVRSFGPKLFILNLDVAKQGQRLLIQKNGIVFKTLKPR